MPQYLTYRRLSKEEKKTKSIGLQWQADTIAAWLSGRKEKSAGDYVDDGVSGGSPIHSRPDGKRLLDQARQQSTVIVVAKTDRLFRSLVDMALCVDDWRKHEVSLVSVTEGYDFTTTGGRMMLGILCVLAQAERETTGDRLRAGAATRKAHGLKWTRDVPYGFRMEGGEAGDDGIQRGGLIVPDKAEQEIIRRIKVLRTRGLTLRAIAKKMNEMSVPTRRGGPWIHTMIQHIIQTFKERTK